MSKKKHADYWKARQEDILRYLDKADIDVSAELSRLYSEQAVEAQKDLYNLYMKYAKDNNLTYQEAQQRLRHEDLSDYRKNAEQYRKQAEKDPELLKRLNEQYVSSRATRLDALALEMTFRAGVLRGLIDKTFEKYLKNSASYAYSKAVGGRAGTINAPVLKQLIETPFNGYNYSQQVWGHVDNLAKDLKEVLKRGFVRGDGVRELAREISKKYDVARHRAETLIRTDGTMVINNATAKRYMDEGLRYYRDLVQLDNRTTKICREVARKDERKLLSEMQPGINVAPYHFNCRTTIVPDDEEREKFKDTSVEIEKEQKEKPIPTTKKQPSDKSGHLFTNHTEAEQYAMSNGVQYANFSKMKPEWYNAILNHLDKLPEEARPVVLTDTKTLQQLSGIKMGRNAKSYYGVSQYISGHFEKVDGELVQFRDGTWIGFNTVSYKTLKSLEKAKDDFEQRYFDKFGKKWSLLKTAEETIAHELGHLLDNHKNASDNWEWKNIAKQWHEESNYDHLKSPSEAWADAVGLKWNKKDVPSYVEEYMTKYATNNFNNKSLFETTNS